MGPGLSTSGDTMYVEKDSCVYYSVRKNSGWSNPIPILKNLKFAHYLQVTNKGNYFLSATTPSSVGLSDWSKVEINGKDSTVKSLGFPINRVVDDQDFYIAKDESYMIVCPSGPIGISYPGKNGTWSNGRSLNKEINFGLSGWGVFVSPDSKYLFYTTGTKQDYSDVNVYWVKMGNIVDSMKNTNLPPYVKNLPKHQTVKAGETINFTFQNDVVCDDDGESIRYEVLSLDGSALPKWLNFDAKTKTISGTAQTAGRTVLRVNAYDDKNALTAFGFVINVLDK